jgi:hypothetical protein
MRIALAWFAATALIAAIAACTSFSATDPVGAQTEAGTSPESGGRAEGGDAGEPADASDDSGGNLLENAGFELGCGGWDLNGASAVADGLSRTGTRSCLVCATADASVVEIDQTVNAVPGAAYTAEAWLRAPDMDGAAPAAIFLGMGVEDATQMLIDPKEAPGPVLSKASWTFASTSLPRVQDGGVTLTFSILSRRAGSCFLIDDAVLRRTP